jgi:putative membrane protein
MGYNICHKELNILHTLTVILIWVVALEHIGIMGLELLSSDQLLAKSFDLPLNAVQQPILRSALSNQGLYNGFVALALFLALFIPGGMVMRVMLACFLACIFIIASYGTMTVTKKIIWLQGCPALITLIFVLFFL